MASNVAVSPLESLEPRTLLSSLTVRVDLTYEGKQINGGGQWPVVSANGRFVVFESDARGIVRGDTNGLTDIFLRDRLKGTTVRVSVSSSGRQANGASSRPAISANGRYVAFASSATNLVSGDTNGCDDIFVYDRRTARTRRVSVSSAERQGNGDCSYPALSADGMVVAFSSEATNLVSGDRNDARDVFVRDRQAGTTVRASLDAAGDPLTTDSYASSASVSNSGRYVAFRSGGSVLVRDLQAQATQVASLREDGQGAPGVVDFAFSGNGRFVAFTTAANGVVAGDDNDRRDIFVRDLSAGATTRVTPPSATPGNLFRPALSADGQTVLYCFATRRDPEGEDGLFQVYRYDRQADATQTVSVLPNGNDAGSDSGLLGLDLSGDGRWAVFTSYSSQLVPGDTNNFPDVFARDLAPPTLSVRNGRVRTSRGVTEAVFTVALSDVMYQRVTVDYRTVPASAVAGVDFQRTLGTLRFAPGQTRLKIRVPILPRARAGRTFLVRLHDARRATIADALGLCTI